MTCLFLVVNINDVRQVELGDYINYYGVPQQPFSSRKAQWNSTSLPSVCKCWLSAWSSPGALGGARFPLVVFAEWVSSGALPDVSLRYQLHHSRAAGTPCSAKNNDHGTKLTSKIQAPKAGKAAFVPCPELSLQYELYCLIKNAKPLVIMLITPLTWIFAAVSRPSIAESLGSCVLAAEVSIPVKVTGKRQQQRNYDYRKRMVRKQE